jgi:hypothetical protein
MGRPGGQSVLTRLCEKNHNLLNRIFSQLTALFSTPGVLHDQ